MQCAGRAFFFFFAFGKLVSLSCVTHPAHIIFWTASEILDRRELPGHFLVWYVSGKPRKEASSSSLSAAAVI